MNLFDFNQLLYCISKPLSRHELHSFIKAGNRKSIKLYYYWGTGIPVYPKEKDV